MRAGSVCAQLLKGGWSGYRYSSAKSGYVSANLLKSAEETRAHGYWGFGRRVWSSSLGLRDPPLPSPWAPPLARPTLAGVGSMFMVLEVRTRPTLGFSLLHTKSQQKQRGSHCILSVTSAWGKSKEMAQFWALWGLSASEGGAAHHKSWFRDRTSVRMVTDTP